MRSPPRPVSIPTTALEPAVQRLGALVVKDIEATVHIPIETLSFERLLVPTDKLFTAIFAGWRSLLAGDLALGLTPRLQAGSCDN
jgi:hypothetical protein